jgi:hypothetical protein
VHRRDLPVVLAAPERRRVEQQHLRPAIVLPAVATREVRQFYPPIRRDTAAGKG